MRAMFLDRDGVLNQLVYYADWQEYESPRVADDLVLLPGVLDAITTLQNDGWQLFLVSNQPSYAKGKTSLENIHGVHALLEEHLKKAGLNFQAFYYSYTHPNGVVAEYTRESQFRKPNPGFLLKAKDDYQLDLSQCWMVGDCDSDIECGQSAGCKTALITYIHSAPKRGTSQPDLVCEDLPDFVQQMISEGR